MVTEQWCPESGVPSRTRSLTLVEAWRFAQEHGIELTVKSPAASIRQVFDVTETGRLVTLRH